MYVTDTVPRRAVHCEEADVHSPWRYALVWCGRPGATSRVKRRTNRRERREGARDVAQQVHGLGGGGRP